MLMKSKNYNINGKQIGYFDCGKGKVIVLLHGYLETKEVWIDFAEKLSINFRVIAIDIPGHGKSEVFSEIHSMELMATVVNKLLTELNIDKCNIVGHSMGGYVMLAFAELFPERVEKIVLFHSSVYADAPEKKGNRLNDIKLINSGKLSEIVDNHIPKTFANDNTVLFKNEINKMKYFGKQNNPSGVIALVKGMMQRKDKQEFIKNYKFPLCFIFGKKDNFISVDVATNMIQLNDKTETVWLSDSGHMGFIEEKEKSLQTILNFITL